MKKFPIAIILIVALAAILLIFRSEKPAPVALPAPPETAVRPGNPPKKEEPARNPSGFGPKHYQFTPNPNPPPNYPPPEFDPRVKRTDDGKIQITTAISRAETLNAAGELLDRYGNPYFFHANSESSMDIWSRGPDGQLNTGDDVGLFEQIGSPEPDHSGDPEE